MAAGARPTRRCHTKGNFNMIHECIPNSESAVLAGAVDVSLTRRRLGSGSGAGLPTLRCRGAQLASTRRLERLVLLRLGVCGEVEREGCGCGM